MNRQTAASSSANQALSKARSAKQDEFYTQLADIEKELKHYRTQLRDKVILCNCDDPYESNFFRYFALNFNALGSGLVDQSQKMTVAARAMAERKTVGHRS